MLLEVMRLDFAVQDSALFLDLRPHDECALQYFREHLELLLAAKDEYECRYGPLSNRSADAEDYARSYSSLAASSNSRCSRKYCSAHSS